MNVGLHSVIDTPYVTPLFDMTEIDLATKQGRVLLLDVIEDTYLDAASFGLQHLAESGNAELYSEFSQVLSDTFGELQGYLLSSLDAVVISEADAEYIQYLYDQLVSLRNLLRQQLVLLQNVSVAPTVALAEVHREIEDNTTPLSGILLVHGDEGWGEIPIRRPEGPSVTRALEHNNSTPVGRQLHNALQIRKREVDMPDMSTDDLSLNEQVAVLFIAEPEVAQLFTSYKSLAYALDKMVSEIEAAAEDPLASWLGERTVSLYPYLASEPIVHIQQLGRRTDRREWVQQKGARYETLLAWIDYVDALTQELAETRFDIETQTLSDLVALHVISARV